MGGFFYNNIKKNYKVITELYTDMTLFKVFTLDLNDRYFKALIKATELSINNKFEQGKQLLIENGRYAQSRDDVSNFLYMNYNAGVLDYYFGNNPDSLIDYTLKIEDVFKKSNRPIPKWLIQSYELVAAAFLEVGYRDNNKEYFECAKIFLNEEIEYDSRQGLDNLNAWIMFAEVFHALGDMKVFKIRVDNLRNILSQQEFQMAKDYWRKHGINV